VASLRLEQYLVGQEHHDEWEDLMSTSTEERRQGGISTGQIEYQMRFRDLIGRAARQTEPELEKKTCDRFLTISREAGSRGAEVAQRIGERLGWAVLDKNLVDRLAGDLKLQPRVLELLDETRINWFSETLLNLFNSRLVAQQGYVELLGKVIALAATSEPVVIVGRGAHLILPPDAGLRVRVVAPRILRVQWMAASDGVTLQAGEKRVDAIDEDRGAFISRNFRQESAEASAYDLVLNAASLGVDGCVEVAVRALEFRGLV
jgi:cytidylate kinase